MGNMKVWTLLVLAIWVCWLSILVVSAEDRPLMEEDTLLGFTTITFDTAGATKATYRNFMQEFRDKLKDNAIQRPDGIPVTRHGVKEDSEDRYLIVKIGPKSKRVALAIDVVDLYVLGYRDIYNNRNRDHYFEGVSTAAQNILSKGADLLPLPFDGSYKELEKKAGDRMLIELGIAKLEYAIQAVYGLPTDAKDRNKLDATFLIIAIQMVAEAARFKHIEEKVLSSIKGKGDYGSFKPDTCMTKLETNWDQLSKAAFSGTEAFKKKIEDISCPADGSNLITEYMGILKYQSGASKTVDDISFLSLYDIVSTD